MVSQILFVATNCFPGLVRQTDTILHVDRMLYFQMNLNAISLERGDFKFPTGILYNKFPYMVEMSRKILQSAFCLPSRDFNMVVNVKEECNAKSYDPKLEEKKTSETKQQ